MENHRPPRKTSPGQKQFQDRQRQSGQNRRGETGSRLGRGFSFGAGYGTRIGSDGNRAQRTGKFGSANRDKPVGPAKDVRDNLIPITSDLQITDGKFRGKFLKNSASFRMQPTPRKLREIMFKVVSRRVRAGRFLDLGSGPGTLGIEAISRGAMVSTFVERSAKMCSFIRNNFDELGIRSGHGEVNEIEITPFLKRMQLRRREWDLVYFKAGGEEDDVEIFAFFEHGCPVAKGGLLMIEHTSDREFPEEIGCMKKWRMIGNEGSKITFYQRK